MKGDVYSIKRFHGIGNVFLLIPVLKKLSEQNKKIELVVRPEWVSTLSELLPFVRVTDRISSHTIDLDKLTENILPSTHKSIELGKLLNIDPPFKNVNLSIPQKWSEPFNDFSAHIIISPEAGHESRQLPFHVISKLCEKYNQEFKTILVGLNPAPEFSCDIDLRGKLSLSQLLGLISNVKFLLTMDSGILHISNKLGKRNIAIFGGINPEFRVEKEDKCLVIQSKLECCPCNKNESCFGRYDCIKSIPIEAINKAVRKINDLDSREIWYV